jgi:uncharacterized membrane protein
MSLVSVVCCFGVIIRPTECGLSDCDRSLGNEEVLVH